MTHNSIATYWESKLVIFLRNLCFSEGFVSMMGLRIKTRNEKTMKHWPHANNLFLISRQAHELLFISVYFTSGLLAVSRICAQLSRSVLFYLYIFLF